MRFLFYLESYPMRDSDTPQRNIAIDMSEKIRGLCESLKSIGSEFKVLCSSGYLDIFSERGWSKKDITDIFLVFNGFNPDFCKSWTEVELGYWTDYIAGNGEQSGKLMDEMDLIKRTRYDFTVVLSWGFNSTISDFCDLKNIDYLDYELGPVRSPIASTMRLSNNGRPINFVETIDNKILDEFRSFYFTRGIEHRFSPGLGYKDRNKILVPLQLRDDYNICIRSEFRSMTEFLEFVLSSSSEFTFYVRPHPSAVDRGINQQDHENCKRMVASCKHAVWFEEDLDRRTIYQNFSALLSVNSGMAYEAMLDGLPVKLFGESDFKARASSISLNDFLEEVKEGNSSRVIDNDAIEYFLSQLWPRSSFLRQDLFLLQVFIAISKNGLSAKCMVGPGLFFSEIVPVVNHRSRKLRKLKRDPIAFFKDFFKNRFESLI